MNLLKIIKISIFSFFLFLYLIVYMVMTNDKDEQIKETLNQQIQYLDNNYQVSTGHFKTLSDNFYNITLNQEDVLKLFYQAKHSKTNHETAAIREKLYNKIHPKFKHLSKAGAIILLFSFEDNRTFLRIHKPSKYGDDLSDVRYSFTYVNDQKKIIRGFEQGKISHAFRNIFPLYYNGEYLGSVDLAFSSEVLQNNMNKLHGIETHFILNKKIFDVNIWKSQKKVKYIQSIEHKDFLFALTSSIKVNTPFSQDKINLNKHFKDEIYKKIQYSKPFSLYHHDLDKVKIITFSPVKNIKNKKTVAYLVSYTNSFYLEDMLERYLYTNIIFFIGLLTIAFIIVNNIQQRFFLQIRVNEEVKKNKLHQQTLFDQSRMAQMGEMISMIAHQWRQPLASISAKSIDLRIQIDLETFDLKEDKGREECLIYFNDALTDIDKLVQSLTITIDDFRNFYKPNKKNDLISFYTPVNKALNIIKGSLVNDGIEITEACITCDNYKAKIYTNEMMQVVLNILKNSQDNFKEKKTKNPKIAINCNCHKFNDKIILEICDNGGGIPEDILPKIFDPYFSTKDEKNGTGVGLYMSKTIIEEHHNGELLVANSNDGVCFTIILNVEPNQI